MHPGTIHKRGEFGIMSPMKNCRRCRARRASLLRKGQEMKNEKTKGVRLRKMTPEERLLAAIMGFTVPDKCKTRAEREAAMFKIELENSQRDLIDVLMGYRKPSLYATQNKSPLYFTFRALLDFQASGEWGDSARERVQCVMFMLAQLARQIGSCALEVVLRLRIECAASLSFTNAKADRLAARFADCWNLVMSEYELLDDKERLRIRIRPPRPTVDIDDDINPYIKKCMTAEECTAAERKFALERLHKRLPGYVAAVEMKRDAISNAADQISANEPFQRSMMEFFGDIRELCDIFAAETDLYYRVHNDTEYDNDDSLSDGHEKTDETLARESLVAEIGRFLDSAAARARRIGSKAAKEFISVKAILVKRQGDFSTPEVDEFCEYSRYRDEKEKLEIRNDLKRFLVGFLEAYSGFLKDLDASKLGSGAPMEVKIDGYTAEGAKQAKAVINAKPAEQNYFSDTNLRLLFEVSANTPANWRTGRAKPPEGFMDAFMRKDGNAMRACAERYRASRAKGDAMNTKHVKRGISDEQIYRESL